jgi:hypothetical protein
MIGAGITITYTNQKVLGPERYCGVMFKTPTASADVRTDIKGHMLTTVLLVQYQIRQTQLRRSP